jgi:hypothetical protein
MDYCDLKLGEQFDHLLQLLGKDLSSCLSEKQGIFFELQ